MKISSIVTEILNSAETIVIACVLTAVPRWVVLLLRADGLDIPEALQGPWLALSALLALGMPASEALAINYIFKAWRNQKDKKAGHLAAILVPLFLTFLVAMTPSIMAQAYHVPLEQVLGGGWMWMVWSASIGLSTLLAVAGVGYASKESTGQSKKPSEKGTREPPHGQNGDTSETVHGQSTGPSTLSTRESMMDSIVDMYRDSPGARPVDIQRQLGLPKSTYYKYISKLVETGRLAQDGDGLHATETAPDKQ